MFNNDNECKKTIEELLKEELKKIEDEATKEAPGFFEYIEKEN
ncbi:hypothetical protein [Bacillus sp. FSL R9-9410]